MTSTVPSRAPSACSQPSVAATGTTPAADASRANNNRGLTLFDLPLPIREQIYDHVFHDDFPVEPDLDDHTPPFVPRKHFGLLCTSRAVYEEVSAVLYRTVHLGSDAEWAQSYVEFLGPRRIRQIRNLVMFFRCRCTIRNMDYEMDWNSVFGLMWSAWACVDRVEVYYDRCYRRPWGNSHVSALLDWRPEPYKMYTCEAVWNVEKTQSFWTGLKAFSMAREINFFSPAVPEFLINRQARETGWERKGVVISAEPRPATSKFRGKLVNPWFGHEFDWHLYVHQCIEEGIDVDKWTYRPDDNSWMNDSQLLAWETAHSTAARPNHLHLLSLPAEIRRLIWDFACHWEYRLHWPLHPRRWNSGIGLLCANKLLAVEVLPSLYRTYRINACSTTATLAHLGPSKLALIQHLELRFSCFCPLPYDQYNAAVESTRNRSQDDNTEPTLAEYVRAWRDAVCAVGCRPLALRSLDVTMTSCVRFADHEPPHEFYLRERCAALEEAFLDVVVVASRGVERLVLRGDVPPSVVARVQQRERLPRGLKPCAWPAGDVQLQVTGVGRWIREFVRGRVAGFKGAGFPRVCWAMPWSLAQFVLESEGSVAARWKRSVGEEGRAEEWVVPVGGDAEVWERPWGELREDLDYDSVQASVSVSEEAEEAEVGGAEEEGECGEGGEDRANEGETHEEDQ